VFKVCRILVSVTSSDEENTRKC